jgi:hypothetical protein
VGDRGRNDPALYAHMNKIKIKKKNNIDILFIFHRFSKCL